MYGKLHAIVTKPGKMGYGSYTQLVIYGEQLLDPSNRCHKRNGGTCKPRPSPATSEGLWLYESGAGGNFPRCCAFTLRRFPLARLWLSVLRPPILTGDRPSWRSFSCSCAAPL